MWCNEDYIKDTDMIRKKVSELIEIFCGMIRKKNIEIVRLKGRNEFLDERWKQRKIENT